MPNCHLCQKSVKVLHSHLKNYHKWSAEEIKQYKMEAKQRQDGEEDKSRYASRQLSWTEITKSDEVRAKLMNLTAQIFRQIHESLAKHYEHLHGESLQLLLSIPSGADIGNVRKEAGDNVRQILKPSIDFLDKVNNVEMIRLANQLQSEIYLS